MANTTSSCISIQKSLAWCQGTPEYAGVRRRVYYLAKSEIVAWPTLERDANGVRATSAKYKGDFTLKADAKWKFIDILPDKSQLTSEPQGELPSQTQLNKLVAVHPGVSVTTNRYEAQWKNAYMFQDASNSSLALMLHGSWHDASNAFGTTDYDVTQKNGYAQLLFESDITPAHNISVGASLNHDYFKEEHSPDLTMGQTPTETTAGVYAQYTFKDGDRWTVMPGIRWDHSSVYGSFVTPRLHIKYTPTKVLTMRAAVGKGYRTPHALAENTPLLACGRTFYFADSFSQEKAWNYGLSASLNVPVAGKNLELNAEYYYTRFSDQMVIDVDGAMGPNSIYFSNLDGTSRSHTAQIDATYPFIEGFSATAAFRLNDARTTYNGELRLRPLTSRYKGLLTLSYKTPMDIWHFDVTGQLNGRGELYDRSEYPTYFNLQAQITREFRLFDLYIGGENLTNYKMKDPIIGASNPWNPGFDATQVWGPTDGAMAYIGIRFKLEKF